jgi:hypothetical protein
MAKNAWKNKSTTLLIRLRCTAMPFMNGAGYSKATMTRPRMIENIGIIGALTIMSMKNASWFAGLGTRIRKKQGIQKQEKMEGLKHALYTPRVTHDTTDKVPEEFAVDKPKIAGPNSICVR